MTAAFLILAHDNPRQLRRLVDRLGGPGATSFIHLDRKSERAPFEDVLAGSDAHLLPEQNSLEIFWGGFNIVRATLIMLRQALIDTDATSFCLLSNSCYPTRPLTSILSGLRAPGQHLRLTERFSPTGTRDIDRFYIYHHRPDNRWLNPRSGVEPLRLTFNALARLVPRRYLEDFPVYHGSGWWVLDRRAAQYVVEFTESHPDVLRWFSGALLADEAFFGSILRNSHFAREITQNYVGGLPEGANPNLHGVHYIDWSASRNGSPKLLTLDDLEPITESGALFARKLSPQTSASLMDALDRQR